MLEPCDVVGWRWETLTDAWQHGWRRCSEKAIVSSKKEGGSSSSPISAGGGGGWQWGSKWRLRQMTRGGEGGRPWAERFRRCTSTSTGCPR